MIYFWIFVALIVYAYMYYSDPKRVIDKMFPGPTRLPFFGNALSFITSPAGMYQMYLDLPKYYDYKTFRMWLLHMPCILVTDYKVAKSVLCSPLCMDKSDEYKFYDPWLGEQFFYTGPVFDENSKVFCEKLKKHDGMGAFDVSEYINLFSLDNICAAAMEVNFHTQNDPGCDYVKALKDIVTVAYNRIIFLWLRSDTIFKLSSTGSLQKNSLNILHGYSNKVIQERKLQLQQYKNDDDKHEDKGTENLKQKKGFLDTILENGKAVGYGDTEIRQLVDAILFAGHDTVSATLGFLFYVLAQHQEIQENVYQEIKKVFQKSDRYPTYEDLQELKYMEQTIKETLRLYTVGPLIARKPKADFYINEKQYIPKGTTIALLIGAIHRDLKIWPEPEKFDPERFSPEASYNRDPYTFLAFSGGSKNCIGSKFAMFEMKITLCRVLRRFKLSLSGNPKDEIQMRPNLILYSKNGIRIQLESRVLNDNKETKI